MLGDDGGTLRGSVVAVNEGGYFDGSGFVGFVVSRWPSIDVVALRGSASDGPRAH